MASRKLLNKTVCVVGPGYVGLPLARAFAEIPPDDRVPAGPETVFS